MATYSIIDTNDAGIQGRGSIGSLTALTTSLVWTDLTNPGSTFPFVRRLSGLPNFTISFEGTFSMTYQVLFSLQDTTPASTPAGSSAVAAWPNSGSFTTAQTILVPNGVRWVAMNCSSFSSGSGTGWAVAIFPSR